MSLVSTLGIDLAKNTFPVHGVSGTGEVVLRRTVSRGKLRELVAQLTPCLIGMEACTRAHEWARQFSRFGHAVKLMAPKFEHDGRDTEQDLSGGHIIGSGNRWSQSAKSGGSYPRKSGVPIEEIDRSRSEEIAHAPTIVRNHDVSRGKGKRRRAMRAKLRRMRCAPMRCPLAKEP